ncbi:pqsA [Symbiodinium microadriaticum]|nr:pqsA [Symbiodinium microadriaticum]
MLGSVLVGDMAVSSMNEREHEEELHLEMAVELRNFLKALATQKPNDVAAVDAALRNVEFSAGVPACLSYRQLFDYSVDVARGLQEVLRLGGGSGRPTVGTCMRRGNEFYVTFLAASYCHFPIAAMSTDHPDQASQAKRNQQILSELRPAILVCDATVRQEFAAVTHINFQDLMAQGRSHAPFYPAPADETAVLCYQYTGGTTGQSRCCAATHAMALWEISKYPEVVRLEKGRVLQQHSVYWMASMAGEIISCAGLVPSILAELDPRSVPSLKVVFTWGEMASGQAPVSEIEILKQQMEILTKQFGSYWRKRKSRKTAEARVQEEIGKGKKDRETLESQLQGREEERKMSAAVKEINEVMERQNGNMALLSEDIDMLKQMILELTRTTNETVAALAAEVRNLQSRWDQFIAEEEQVREEYTKYFQEQADLKNHLLERDRKLEQALQTRTAVQWAKEVHLIDLLIASEYWLTLFADWTDWSQSSSRVGSRPAFRAVSGAAVRLRPEAGSDPGQGELLVKKIQTGKAQLRDAVGGKFAEPLIRCIESNESTPVPQVDLLVCGPSCAYMSGIRRNASRYVGCLEPEPADFGHCESSVSYTHGVLQAAEKMQAAMVLYENVPKVLHRCKDDAGEEHPAAIERVEADLVLSQYDVAYRCVDSHNFGLPQRRNRAWLMACKGSMSGKPGVDATFLDFSSFCHISDVFVRGLPKRPLSGRQVTPGYFNDRERQQQCFLEGSGSQPGSFGP